MIARAALVGALALGLGCGARTGLEALDGGPVAPPCVTDRDCDDGRHCTGTERCLEGRCAAGDPVECAAPAGVCDEARCDDTARACVTARVSADRDGDGYFGRVRGRPACGDDCDDDNPAVHPGATEVCNSRDDDCDGAVDEGSRLVTTDTLVRVSDAATQPGGPGGLAWTGASYTASWWAYQGGKARVFVSPLDRLGQRQGEAQPVSLLPADAFGAALAWTGRAVGAVWQDRRDPGAGYEVYFNRFDPTGARLGPDVRVSGTAGHSIQPALVWTGTDFVVVWQEAIDRRDPSRFVLAVRRLDATGRPATAALVLAAIPRSAEGPSIAAAPDGTLGVAWTDTRDGGRAVYFEAYTLGETLRIVAPARRVSPPGHTAVHPHAVFNAGAWALTWYDDAAGSSDREVWGAVLGSDGAAQTAARRLTADAGFSRYPRWLPFGDRLLLVWGDDRADARYALWAQVFSPGLVPLTEPMQVTPTAPSAASVSPTLSFGPDGDVGVLFRDARDGRIGTWFTRLRCEMP